ncbi:hypothetical protein BUALT_Bualt03G0015900 [Buddleja alternifolia]|uniref:Uncharacterized protein n=1 Tax=Buddleja alternifolia TaxID=168488 RepID=A0AAV6XRW6_9LAMI|nr:hypothetical protein BUALT_Bualt03G0015900 [Buddleja alternifolia]
MELGFGCTDDLGKYLGVPIFHDRVSLGSYRSLIDRVQARLFPWKAKLLNLTGRVTLIKSVMAALPIHTMQSAWLPQGTSVSLHSHATSVTVFNGLNFSEWREQVNFHLGVLDLDLALLEEKPTDITNESSDTEKLKLKAWDRA